MSELKLNEKPCPDCGDVYDLRELVYDPLEECYGKICIRCADNRRREAEERQAYDYEYRMPEYQKHIP